MCFSSKIYEACNLRYRPKSLALYDADLLHYIIFKINDERFIHKITLVLIVIVSNAFIY